MPRDIVAGLFCSKSGSKSGFVTCKYMDKGWLKSSTFSRLTGGYSPSQSKDPEKQLKKALYNKVTSFPNEPAEGFRVTGQTFDIYSYKTGEYKKSAGDFIIADPRGFEIGIKARNFARIISSCDMSNGSLLGKYAYAWTVENGHEMTLLKEGTPDFEDAALCLDEFEKREKPKDVSVKKNELVVGHAYSATKVLEGDWIYAGIHDTYSDACHMDAFDSGKYDIERSVEKEKDWPSSGYYAKFKTSSGRMVFFPAKLDRNRPWIARSDISGVFGRETILPDAFHFADSPESGDPPTVDSIKDAVSVCPAFQKIDFSRFALENRWETLSLDVVEDIFGSFRKFTSFPFDKCYYALVKAGDRCASSDYAGCWVKISIDKYSSSNEDWRVVNITRLEGSLAAANARSLLWPIRENAHRDMYRNMSLPSVYNLVNPVVPVMYFENGKRVPQHIAMAFVPANIRSICNRYC